MSCDAIGLGSHSFPDSPQLTPSRTIKVCIKRLVRVADADLLVLGQGELVGDVRFESTPVRFVQNQDASRCIVSTTEFLSHAGSMRK